MFRFIIIIKTLILFALIAFAAADDENYTLEKVDIADLVSNIGKLKKFIDCLINKGPCSEMYQSYKVIAPESIKQGCKKCSVELKQFGNQFLETFKTSLPEEYVLFRQIYDPENKYIEALEIELKKYEVE